jgi:hypothetical protein
VLGHVRTVAAWSRVHRNRDALKQLSSECWCAVLQLPRGSRTRDGKRDRQVSAVRHLVQVDKIQIAYVFFESGLSINVMYDIDDRKRRAVGFKLSDGMDVPIELASRFKFATQKSKLAGTIRGSFFVINGEY